MSAPRSSKTAVPIKSNREQFARLCDRVAAGQQLPRVTDLVQGCPFLGDDMRVDAKAFAEQTLRRLGAADDDRTGLVFALAELTCEPNIQDFIIAATEFEKAAKTAAGELISQDMGIRCYLYATMLGHNGSKHKMAAVAVSTAYSRELPEDEVPAQCRAAVAWLLAATGKLALPPKWTRQAASEFLETVDKVPGPGRQMLERVMKSRQDILAGSINLDDALIGPTDLSDDNASLTVEPVSSLSVEKTNWPTIAGDEDIESSGVVVLAGVGNSQTPDGRRVAAEFEAILGKRLPLTPTPDLTDTRTRLLTEFPYAAQVIDTILEPLSGRQHVALPPTILVGLPGCGKTTFAIRLAELLNLQFEIVPCGGVADGSLGGTARRWATGQAALPVSVIRSSGSPHSRRDR